MRRSIKQVALWVILSISLALLLFLAALQIFGPRIVNQDAIKNRIETAVSKELGGRLQYEMLAFRILPRPSIQIRQPAFEIPGSVSGRLQALYIDFEPLSILTGSPRIAETILDRPDMTFTLGGRDSASGPSATASSAPPVAPVLGWLAIRMPSLTIAVEKGRWVFVRDRETLFSLDSVDGRIAFATPSGPSRDSGKDEAAEAFRIIGQLRAVLNVHAAQPEPIQIDVGGFEANPSTLVISEGRLASLDTTARFSGRIEDYLSGTPTAEVSIEGTAGAESVRRARTAFALETAPPGSVFVRIPTAKIASGSIQFSESEVRAMDATVRFSGVIKRDRLNIFSADLSGEGTVGPDLMKWVWATTSLPDEWAVRAPVSLRPVHLDWSRGGRTHLDGSLTVQQNVSITFDLERAPDEIAIQTLRVKDQDSKAEMAVRIRNRVLDLSFSGNLAPSTLDRVFEQKRLNFGWAKGHFQSRAVLDRPRESTVRGRLEAERVLLPFKTRLPVLIDRVVIQASDRTIQVDPLVLTVGEVQNTVRGRIEAGLKEWKADLSSDALKWESIYGLFAAEAKPAGPPSPERNTSPIRATILAAAPAFTIAGWTASPARAEISIGPGPVRIAVRKAVVCGIDLPGTITIPPAGMTLEINPSAQGQSLESTISCLGAERQRATGTFDLSGQLRASGSGAALLDSLDGTLSIDARDGRIMEDSITLRILTYLNVTDLLRGQFSNLGNEGVPYQSAVFRARVEKGTLSFDEMVLKSPVVNLVGKGTISLSDKTIDLTVLAAPFTSIDKMIGKIPLIRYIMAGTLVTVPIRVTGPFDRPDVKTMPPGAVAGEVAGMMKRVLQTPFKIIEPILPGGEESR